MGHGRAETCISRKESVSGRTNLSLKFHALLKLTSHGGRRMARWLLVEVKVPNVLNEEI